MKYRLFILFLFFNKLLIAQNYWGYKTDSVETYLKKDTIRANFLIRTTQYNSVRDFHRNQSIINEIFEIARKEHSQKHLILAKNLLTDYFFQKGDRLKAMNLAIKALEDAEKIDYNKGIRQAKLNIAKIEIDNKKFENLNQVFQDILANKYGVLSIFERANVNYWLADYYLSKTERDFENSLKSINISKELFDKVNSLTGVALTHSFKARFYKVKFLVDREKEYLQLSRNFVDKPLKFFKKENQLYNLAYVYYTKATTYSIQGKHLESIPYYEKALEIYKSLKELLFNMRIKQHLFVAYSITKNTDKAIKVNKKFVLLKDSIFNMERRRLIEDAQAKFDNQRLKNAKQIAEIESKRNKGLFNVAVIIALLSILSALFMYSSFRNKKKVEIAKLRLKQAENKLALEKKYRYSELKALKSQMNPHFVFNALNSIQDYIIHNQKNLAGDYLGKFADLIRNYLDQSSLKEIALRDEISTLKRYLELEQIRFESSLIYSVDVNEDLQVKDVFIPTMLIQPYVENALKHGLLHKKEKGFLSIKFSNDKTHLICVIEDNGIGRKKSERIKNNRFHKPFATKATQSRIDLLNYERDKKIEIFMEDVFPDKEDTGTRVTIKIPLNAV